MGLQATLNRLLAEYSNAKSSAFADNPIADYIRRDIPRAVEVALGHTERYVVEGSPGRGVWAGVPWIAVFDRFVTESAQDGYYLVYLLKEDSSGIYLSLNQGVTSIRQQYGSATKDALGVRAADFASRLGGSVDGLLLGTIDLAVSSSTSLGALYEHGAICSIYYARNAVPSDLVLTNDLHRFAEIYLSLVSNEQRLFTQVDSEEDESDLGEEDLRKLREHKRIERNKKLAVRAKKIHGYKCKACGFDFGRKYGAIGAGFIEAHHLTPLAELRGKALTLDATRDFTVLCSNCHRMIHRSEFVSRVEEFRATYVVKGED